MEPHELFAATLKARQLRITSDQFSLTLQLVDSIFVTDLDLKTQAPQPPPPQKGGEPFNCVFDDPPSGRNYQYSINNNQKKTEADFHNKKQQQTPGLIVFTRDLPSTRLLPPGQVAGSPPFSGGKHMRPPSDGLNIVWKKSTKKDTTYSHTQLKKKNKSLIHKLCQIFSFKKKCCGFLSQLLCQLPQIRSTQEC